MALSLSPQSTRPEHAPAQDVLAEHAERAQQAEQQGDFATAVREYGALERALPGNPQVASNLGVALYFDHQWDQAIIVLHRAMSSDPKLVAPHLFTGLAEYQLSRPGAAIPELRTAVRLHPEDALARLWLGYAYVAQAQYEPAEQQFVAVTQLQPENIDAWYALGEAWLQIGRPRTEALLHAAPNGGRAWQLAGEQLRLQGNTTKALADFEQAAARRPDVAEVRQAITELGGTPPAVVARPAVAGATAVEDRLFRAAQAAEANSRAAFEKVLTLTPDSYRAHQIVADADVLQQQDAKAVAEYREVLAAKPDLPGVHQAMGSALLRLGKAADALQEFEAEQRLQPHSASIATLVGQAQMLLGQNSEAEATLHAALGMERPPPDAWRLLGKLELHRNDNQAAASDLKRYLAEQPKDATAWYLLSRAYRGLKDQPQMAAALAQYEKLSEDARQRNEAQMELSHANASRHLDDLRQNEGARTQ